MYKKVMNNFTNSASTIAILKKDPLMIVPFDEANTDYQEYLEWVAEGNTPEEAE